MYKNYFNRTVILKRNFQFAVLLTKCVKDISEIKDSDGKLYVFAIFDDFDSADLGVSKVQNMQASLCVDMLDNAIMAYADIKGAIVHSDRGVHYIFQTCSNRICTYSSHPR